MVALDPKLRRQRQDWDDLAELDPLHAIYTDLGRTTPWALAEFFATGEAEVAVVMAAADELGLPERRERALDFGCGVGRTTRALASYFEECHGVDISERMVRRARELNAEVATCSFSTNLRGDLAEEDSGRYDLVYSSVVLQHMPTEAHALAYIGEFLRVLRPGGLAAFQVPYAVPFLRRAQPRRRAWAALRLARVPEPFLYRRLRLSPMRTIALPLARIRKAVDANGGVVEQYLDAPQPNPSYFYFVRRAD